MKHDRTFLDRVQRTGNFRIGKSRPSDECDIPAKMTAFVVADNLIRNMGYQISATDDEVVSFMLEVGELPGETGGTFIFKPATYYHPAP